MNIFYRKLKKKEKEKMSLEAESASSTKPSRSWDDYDPSEAGYKSIKKEQYAKEVTYFSSQYGGESTISYAACNLAGQPNVYPQYGDYTQACVFRTYGPWWKIAPSHVRQLRKTPQSFCSDDFIELTFEEKVYPDKIEIYETYNPGTVVKILAFDCSGTDVDTGHNSWIVLWSGSIQYPPAKARIFAPPLKKVDFQTDLIRLELCHIHVNYYTELDTVRLIGYQGGRSKDWRASDDVEGCDKHSQEKPYLNMMKGLSIHGDEEVAEFLNGHFDILPGEVIQLILRYLDVQALCRLAQTCRLLYDHCSDPLQFLELNLQPHWAQVDNSTLDNLHCRCQHIQRLSLAWCGSRNTIDNKGFKRFLNNIVGTELTCLYLACCNFVNADTLQLLGQFAPNLKELDLQCCRKLEAIQAFGNLKELKLLERLNLYRTHLDTDSLMAIVGSCRNLTHLNIGSCVRLASNVDILSEIGRNCKNMKCLDCWRLKAVTEDGLKCLAENCLELEELDVGWCMNLNSNSDCFTQLIKKCRNLKKLFLTANRTVCDDDMNAVAQFSSNMEQLDILGTREVSSESAYRVLKNCKKLTMFDVSFCSGITLEMVTMWQEEFPLVSVKKSFQMN